MNGKRAIHSLLLAGALWVGAMGIAGAEEQNADNPDQGNCRDGVCTIADHQGD